MTSSEAKNAAPKEYKTIIDSAARQGWSFSRDGSGHLAVRNPGTGQVVTISTTANDAGRHFRNTRSNFLRAGLRLQGRVPKVNPLLDLAVSEAAKPKVTSLVDGPLSITPPRQNEKPVAIAPPKEVFPILEALEERQRVGVRVHEATELMSQAAALLRDKDRDDLLAEAVRLLDTVKLSPVEIEYLAFAKANR
jgi:hypothetical protein